MAEQGDVRTDLPLYPNVNPCPNCARLREERDTFRDAMVQFDAEREALQAVVDRLPTRKILRACEYIDAADYDAQFSDGDVPPTHAVMSSEALIFCMRTLWQCKAAAEAAKETNDG